MKTSQSLLIALLLLVSVVISACLSRKTLPAASGMMVQVRPAKTSLPSNHHQANQTLQVSWFGSGCHLLQLGDQVILTDPFFTSPTFTRGLHSRNLFVKSILEHIPNPQAILVNHSHFDHFFDAQAALQTRGWENTHLYGGQTCEHLIAGWQEDSLTKRVRALPQAGGQQSLRNGLSFHSYRSRHSPHLSCGITLLDHTLSKDRTTPPRLITDFPAGETYNFLIRMRSSTGPGPHPEFTIFYLAAPADLKELPNSVPQYLPPVDLVIVPAPGQDKVPNFPGEHLARLRPRHVLIDHFNHFIAKESDRRLELLGIDIAKPEELSRKIQNAVNKDSVWKKRFEAIHIPSLTIITPDQPAKNVVLITK